MGSKALKKIASVALPIAGSFIPGVGPAVGAALGGALGGAIQGNGLKGIALGGLKGYAGNVIGSSIGGALSKAPGLGSTIGSITAKNSIGPFSVGNIGSTALNTVGNSVANTTIGSAIGSYAGNALAGDAVDSFAPQDTGSSQPEAVTPFSPSRQAQMDSPSSLSGFSSLTPDQTSSNIATQGVYGGGNGPEEQTYFTNLVNRRLVDDAGNVDQDLSDLSPIEQSYLSQIGLNGKNPRDLLEAMSRWKAQ